MNFIQNFDFFPKIQQDQPVRKTISGGTLFVLILAAIIILILAQFYAIFI